MILFYSSTIESADVPAPKLGEAFGHNVKRLRTQQGFNKKLFASMCGIGRPLLDSIERGESDVRLSYVQKIADALSISPLELLS